MTRISAAEVGELRDAWNDVARHADGLSPYATHAWLAAWAEVYRPGALRLVEIEDGGGELAALGLIDAGANGAWSFAGGPVTSTRSLVCRAGAEGDSWRALADWLTRHRGEWRTLAAVADVAADGGMRLARSVEVPVPGIDLPADFDDYLAARSSTTRKRIRQRLRRLERAGGEIREVAAGDRADALADMVRLHRERAAFKGEVHGDVDERLARLLDAVAADRDGPRVRVAELLVDGERAGVNARLDHRDTAHSYSDGVAVGHLALSPGIVLELDSIRDAIERGFARYDLGPGDHDYKARLGAACDGPRHDLEVVSPSLRGATARVRVALFARVRSLAPRVARPVRRLRARLRDPSALLPPPVVEQIAYWLPIVPYGRTLGG